MDRLLYLLLKAFLRKGTFKLTTSQRQHLHFRRRHRQPGGRALHNARCGMGHPARSRAQARRSLHGRHAGRGARHDRRPARDRARPEHRRLPPTGRACNGCCATSAAGCSSSIRASARGATSRITTISTAGSIRCSSTPTGNTAAPISRRPEQSLDDAQLAKKRHLAAKLLMRARHSACSTSAAAGAGSALYLAEICRRQRHRRHAVAGAAWRVANARAAEKGLADRGRVPPAGLSRRCGTLRPHRLGRHVRACRRRLLRRVFPQVRRAAGRRRRDAAAFDRPLGRARRHQSLDREIHLPRRLHPGAVGGAAARSSAPACSSPTSKSCACTTPRR